MKITTIQEAFHEIERRQERVPIEAIEFLRNHPTTDEIIDKLAFILSNAYTDIYDDTTDGYNSSATLWYAVVAECHPSEKLVQPVISLYAGVEDDWDYLNEQGHLLVDILCKELGDVATIPFLNAIEEAAKTKSTSPTLFLHECLFFATAPHHLAQINRILDYKESIWSDSFAVGLAHAQITAALPKLKELQAYNRKFRPDGMTFYEVKTAIEELETGVLKYPDMAKPQIEQVEGWKTRYARYYEPPKIISKPQEKKKKVGRNDPCPCGSGKKYKKCCL